MQTIEQQVMDEESIYAEDDEPIFFESPERRSSPSDRSRRGCVP
jgi:hypothetical protein